MSEELSNFDEIEIEMATAEDFALDTTISDRDVWWRDFCEDGGIDPDAYDEDKIDELYQESLAETRAETGGDIIDIDMIEVAVEDLEREPPSWWVAGADDPSWAGFVAYCDEHGKDAEDYV